MISKLRWSKIDWLIVLVAVIVFIRLFLPNTGLHTDIHILLHWIGALLDLA